MGKKRIKNKKLAKTGLSWCAWVAQLVEQGTLDFTLGQDLPVHEIEPRVGLCAGGMEPL